MGFNLFILSLLSVLAPPQVKAASNCEFTVAASNVNLTWSTTLPTQQITITVTKKKNPACSYVVTFSQGGATGYNRKMTSGANQLFYQLYKESSLTNILKEVPDVTTSNDAFTGSFGTGANQNATHTYFIQIPLNLATTPTLKPFGSYTNTFNVKVYPGTVSTISASDDSANVTLTTAINRLVQLSLVASSGAFDPNSTSQTMNFGTLTQGDSRGIDMRVLTNAGYTVSFTSANNGVLKHATAGVTTTIPYSLTVSGVAKTLTSGAVVVATGSGQTTTSGTVNPLVVTIGSVTDKIAGNYSDNITVTAATTE